MPARKWRKCTPKRASGGPFDVHFPQILARNGAPARNRAKCTPGCRKRMEVHGAVSASCRKSREVHGGLQRNGGSTRPLASGPFRTFPHHPCIRKISCKDRGEMYDGLHRNGGNGRKTTCRAGRKTFISSISLHEFLHVQQMRGTARKRPCGRTCWERGGLGGEHLPRAAVRPPARRGEPLPQAGSEVACVARDYRRRAVGEPLRAYGLPRRAPSGGRPAKGAVREPLRAGSLPRRTPSGGRTSRGRCRRTPPVGQHDRGPCIRFLLQILDERKRVLPVFVDVGHVVHHLLDHEDAKAAYAI